MARSSPTDIGLLQQLTEAETAALLTAGQAVRHGAGAFIHREGDDKPGLSVVLAGRVQIGNLSEDGRLNVILDCGPGHTFGEITSIIDVARTHDVVALTDCEILQVSAPRFHRLMAEQPGIATALFKMISTRLYLVLETLEEFRQNDPIGRLKTALRRRRAMQAGSETIDVAQSALAYEIGVSRVTLGKFLAKLERQGVIKRDYGKIHVLKPAALNTIDDAINR